MAAVLLWQMAAVSPGAEKLPAVLLQGERYVALEDWSKARGFTYKWDRPGRTVHLTSRWAKLSFLVNTKKATVNGLSLWLSSPVLIHGSGVRIAERDLRTAIHPILFPEKLAKGKAVRTIVIAPGHGGKDPGYQINKEQEKKYTLLLATALRDALAAAGLRVILTHETDVFVDLGVQAARANRAGADLFISLHYNAAAEVEANGVETYCLTPEGAVSTNGGAPTPRSAGHRHDTLNPLLAYQIHKALVNNCGFQDRGIRRAAFQVLREIDMPGVLIEGGFLSNPRDAQKIMNATQRKAAARAITDGILAYKRLVERK